MFLLFSVDVARFWIFIAEVFNGAYWVLRTTDDWFNLTEEQKKIEQKKKKDSF